MENALDFYLFPIFIPSLTFLQASLSHNNEILKISPSQNYLDDMPPSHSIAVLQVK